MTWEEAGEFVDKWEQYIIADADPKNWINQCRLNLKMLLKDVKELIKEEQQVFTEVTAAQAELRTLRLQVQAAKRRWDKAADKVV